jgi:hypothetical protein
MTEWLMSDDNDVLLTGRAIQRVLSTPHGGSRG